MYQLVIKNNTKLEIEGVHKMDEIGAIKKQIIVMVEGLGKEEKGFLLIIYGLLSLHQKE